MPLKFQMLRPIQNVEGQAGMGWARDHLPHPHQGRSGFLSEIRGEAHQPPTNQASYPFTKESRFIFKFLGGDRGTVPAYPTSRKLQRLPLKRDQRRHSAKVWVGGSQQWTPWPARGCWRPACFPQTDEALLFTDPRPKNPKALPAPPLLGSPPNGSQEELGCAQGQLSWGGVP